MLNVVLCGRKTLSLTAGLREDQKLRMLENRVRGRCIIWVKGEEAHGDWRKTEQ